MAILNTRKIGIRKIRRSDANRLVKVARLVLSTSAVGIDREFAQSLGAEKSIQKIQNVGSRGMAILSTRKIRCSDVNRLGENSGSVVES